MTRPRSISARPWTAAFDSPYLPVGLAFAVTVVFFWPTLATLPDTWARWDQGHGWLIAALLVWLIWRDRHRFLAAGTGESVWLAPLLGLSLIWLVAIVAHLQVVHQAAFVLVLACWALALSGSSNIGTVAAFAATAFIALPLWDPLTPILRELTTLVSGNLVLLLGVDADIQGSLIEMPAGAVIVADGCAGVNTFMSALTIGVVYAHLFADKWQKQAAVVALAAAIGVVGNWIRVTILIMAGHLTEMQSPLMRDHVWLGWVIFAVGLVPFLWIAQRITGDSSGPRRVADSEDAEAGETDEDGTTEDMPGRERSLTRRASVATAVAVVGPILYFIFGLLPPSGADVGPLEQFAAGAGWYEVTAADTQSFEWRPAYAGAGQSRGAVFTDGSARVYGYQFVYRDQSPGSELIGYPNRIAPASSVVDDRLIGPIDPEGGKWVRQAVIRSGDGAILTWYWYRVGGVEAALEARAKLLEVPAFFRRRPVAELIAFATECGPENCADAYATLADFLGVRATAGPQ